MVLGSSKLPARLGLSILSGVLALIVLFVALELFLDRRHAKRAAAQKPYYRWSFVAPDGTSLSRETGPLQLVLRPFVVYGNRPGQSTPQFSTDARGFRTTSPPARREAPTIVLLGGSTAFGTGLASDAETFASQLAGLLEARVVNAAVVGHQSGQELVALLTELVDLEPALIITLDGWNDYGFRLTEERFLGTAAFAQIEIQLKQIAGLLHSPRLWDRVSQIPLVVFPRASRSLMARVDQAFSRTGIGYRFLPPRGRRVEISRAAEVYADNVRKMDVVARAFGSRYLSIVQPQNRSPRYAESNEKFDGFISLAAARLAGRVSVLDMNEAANRALLPPERFLDLVHLDAAGNRILAERVADEVRRRGLLLPTAPSEVVSPAG